MAPIFKFKFPKSLSSHQHNTVAYNLHIRPGSLIFHIHDRSFCVEVFDDILKKLLIIAIHRLLAPLQTQIITGLKVPLVFFLGVLTATGAAAAKEAVDAATGATGEVCSGLLALVK